MKPKLSVREEVEREFKESARVEESTRILAESDWDPDADAEFVADFAKGLIVEDLLRALEEEGWTRSELARRLGKSRQYVSHFLAEKANFGIESLAELAATTRRKLVVRMIRRDEAMPLLSKSDWIEMRAFRTKLRAEARRSAKVVELQFASESPLHPESYHLATCMRPCA
jgi:transcriptional regulator with XRE-family HTH domain